MKMIEGIFLINNALNVNQLSVFDNETRFKQTLQTIDSIDRHCENNVKYMFDSSPVIPDERYIKYLTQRNVRYFYFGDDEHINQYSSVGLRSLSETLSFKKMLDVLKHENVSSNRIYKLSGRYRITDDFVLDNDKYKNSFVFSKSLESWMPKQKQDFAKVDKLYRLRFWHMDFNCLDFFIKEIPNIYNDCLTYNIDVEHSYYKNLNTYKVIEVDRICVEGNIAPTGEYINE
jgi:hypothetical protein